MPPPHTRDTAVARDIDQITALSATDPDAVLLGVPSDCALGQLLIPLLHGWPHRTVLHVAKVFPRETFTIPDYLSDIESRARDFLTWQAVRAGHLPYGEITITWHAIPAHLAGERPHHLPADLPEINDPQQLPQESAALCTVSRGTIPYTTGAHEAALRAPNSGEGDVEEPPRP